MLAVGRGVPLAWRVVAAGIGVVIGLGTAALVRCAGALFVRWAGLSGYLWAFPGLEWRETVARVRARFSEGEDLSDEAVLDAVARAVAQSAGALRPTRWLPVEEKPLTKALRRDVFRATPERVARAGLAVRAVVVLGSTIAGGLALALSPIAALAVLCLLLTQAAASPSAMDLVDLLRARLELTANPRLDQGPDAAA